MLNKIRNKKPAFNLAEIMIVLSLIGIVLIYQIQLIKPKINQYSHPYYVAYNALKKANYNILADIQCPDASHEDPACHIGPRPYPTNTDSVAICRRMVEFINPSGAVTCENESVNNADLFRDLNLKVQNGVEKARKFDEKYLKFISTNGMKFYISPRMQYKTDDDPNISASDKAQIEDNRKADLYYYIVYVDINGKKEPNRISMTNEDKIYPDIVPFVITQLGDVIPIGFPTVTNVYMTARVKYPGAVSDNEDSAVMHDKKNSQAMTFYEALYKAWGTTDNIFEPFRYTSNNGIYRKCNERNCGVAALPNVQIPFSIPYSNSLNDTDAAFYKNSTFNLQLDLPEFKLIDECQMQLDENGEAPKDCCRPNEYSCRVFIETPTTKRF